MNGMSPWSYRYSLFPLSVPLGYVDMRLFHQPSELCHPCFNFELFWAGSHGIPEVLCR